MKMIEEEKWETITGLIQAVHNKALDIAIEAVRTEFIDEYGEDDYINQGYGLAVRAIQKLKEEKKNER